LSNEDKLDRVGIFGPRPVPPEHAHDGLSEKVIEQMCKPRWLRGEACEHDLIQSAVLDLGEPPASPKPKTNGVIEESIGFLIPVQCATSGHDPLPDELPMTKDGALADVVVRFCKNCNLVYWGVRDDADPR
jgi:hypothetical protein